jgi:hypothetical protein
MPLFNHAMFKDGNVDNASVDETNIVVDRIRSLLVDRIETRDPTLGVSVAAYAGSYFQSHMRRALEFLDGGVAAYQNGQALVAATCARSVLESVVAVHDFSRRLIEILDEGDMPKALKFITGQAFATKLKHLHDEDGSNIATNILTQIKKLAKEFPELPVIYDQISELTHPNGLGAVGYFSDLDSDDGVIRFSNPTEKHQAQIVRLLGVALFLTRMDHDIRTVAAKLGAIIQTEMRQQNAAP